MSVFRFDPEEIFKDDITLDKFEAAKLQIISAIKTFFYNWDVVSTHTLAGAAHQILHDISKTKGKRLSLKDSKMIKEDKRKEFINAVNRPQNYFKHSDKDQKHKLIFHHKLTPLYLFDTIRMYILLTGSQCFEMRVFLIWIQLRYPDLLNYPPAENDLRKIRADTKDPDAFTLLGLYLLEKGRRDKMEQPNLSEKPFLTSRHIS